ncbi:MAG: AmmeMemoRadiSam system protein B [Sandaracinaceae bacterium]|nr:AmmeMemoRadiSam system protein B [Sandaracinaceae bacterium]
MRPAYLAGRWYPGDRDACRAAIADHTREGASPESALRGLVGPHAGWAFSGDCAGRGYRVLADSAPADVDLVVVFGSHRGPHGPNTVFRDDAWDTPLGPLATDRELADEVARAHGFEDEPARPGRPDNAVELHLPFVRALFEEARLLMVGVEASARALSIGESIGERVRAAGRQAVFIGSTDLTHYGPNYGWAPHGAGPEAVRWVREDNDGGFLEALVADAPERALDHAVAHQSACCPGAAVAAIEATRAYAGAVHPRLVDHYLSYDVRPDASFVGYGSVVV